MAGYFHEQVKHEGRPLPAASFDTMNMSKPVRDQQFNTSTFEQGPHRPQNFETMNLDPPQRGPQTTNNNVHSSGKRIEPEAKKSSERSPEQRESVTECSKMTVKVVIAALSLRVCTALSLVIGLALIASFSKNTLDATLSFVMTVSFSYFASTKYALAVTILGLVYSIFEIVSVTIRLITGRLMFPGRISSYISYIGDQIFLLLLMSGGSAGAAALKDSFCDASGNFCSQLAAGVAMIFLGFVFLIGSYIISTICFHRKKV